MPYTTLFIDNLETQSDQESVTFELQDLPCINQVEVSLVNKEAWIDHTNMISINDTILALEEAGFNAKSNDNN